MPGRPSSTPIPDELVEWYAREMAGKCDGISVFDDECSMPANDATKALYRHDARDYLEEIGSRLYKAWGEDLRDRMHDAVKRACPEYEDTNQGLIAVELCRALGLEGEGDR
jgi:hypothetical protein